MSTDLGPLPLVPKRHGIRNKAELKLMGFLIEWREEFGLSVAEELSIINQHVQRSLQQAIKHEDKRAEK